MKHKFNLWYDFLLPILNKIAGKKYGCCDKIKTVISAVLRTAIRNGKGASE